ncbi:MAG: HutD family protein, partial [Candidatus Saganbacteria bacterium]|nr:HutD family protein [Candidatus Saganbacteria bacterium]
MAQVQLYTAETAMAGTIEALKVQGQATLQRKTAALYKIMPWANGKGNTTELYVFPKEGKLTDRSAVWRVSMASVTENGPFSVLPDYERIITVAQGAGFHIKGNMGTDVVVAPGVKYAFSGKETIECELIGGRCVGLNVFYRKEVSRAELKLLGQGEPLRFG